MGFLSLKPAPLPRELTRASPHRSVQCRGSIIVASRPRHGATGASHPALVAGGSPLSCSIPEPWMPSLGTRSTHLDLGGIATPLVPSVQPLAPWCPKVARRKGRGACHARRRLTERPSSSPDPETCPCPRPIDHDETGALAVNPNGLRLLSFFFPLLVSGHDGSSPETPIRHPQTIHSKLVCGAFAWRAGCRMLLPAVDKTRFRHAKKGPLSQKQLRLPKAREDCSVSQCVPSSVVCHAGVRGLLTGNRVVPVPMENAPTCRIPDPKGGSVLSPVLPPAPRVTICWRSRPRG